MKKLLLFCLSLSAFTVYSQNGLNMDGVDDYVQTTYGGVASTGARTVEAWIRTTANTVPTNGGTQQVMVDWGSFTTGGRSTFCMVWANAIRFEVGGNGLSGTIAVNDGFWHHVAMVYDPGATNTVKLYVDGNLDAEGNVTVPVNTGALTDVQIGLRVDGINSFQGDMDEIRIWNVARTQAEIQANRLTEFCALPVGLEAYYKANQGTAGGANPGLVTLTDASGNGHDGTLTNFSLNGNFSNWANGAPITSGGTSSSITEVSCFEYLAPSGAVFDSTGMYTDVIPNSAGCDSVISIDLTINSVDVGVTEDLVNNELMADEAGAQYRWLNCGQGLAPVAGATSQLFSPTANGTYAVEVTLNGCVDTSSCFTISTIGLNEFGAHSWNLYPNPATNRITVELERSSTLTLSDITGKVVRSEEMPVGKTEWSVLGLPAGWYHVQVANEKGVFAEKLIIQ